MKNAIGQHTRLKTSSVFFVVVVMVLTMFAWGIESPRTVNADSGKPVPTNANVLTEQNSYKFYPYDGTSRHDTEWVSFTPDATGLYKINLSGRLVSESIIVFDQNMDPVGFGIHNVSLTLEKNKTYYIRIVENYPGGYGPYAYIEISVEEADYAVYVEKDGKPLYQEMFMDWYTVSSGKNITFRTVLSVDLRCEWYKYDSGEDAWLNPDRRASDPYSPRTAPSLTVSCPASEADYRLVIYDDRDQVVAEGEFTVINRDLMTIDNKTFSYEPVMTGMNGSYDFTGIIYNSYDSLSNPTSSITRYMTGNYDVHDNTVALLMSGIDEFSVLRLHASYGSWIADKLTFLFVDDPATNEIISSGTTKHISVSNQYNTYKYEQRILEFTPQHDGTYTFSSFNRESGNPEVALFDENYNLIDYAMPYMEDPMIPQTFGVSGWLDDYDYITWGKYDYSHSIYRWDEKQNMPASDICLTADLKAGKTYYFAIPFYNNGEASYDVRITEDGQVPVDTDTPTPTNTNTPTPTKKPAANPTTTTSSPTTRPGASTTPASTSGSSSPTVTTRPPVDTTTPAPSGSSTGITTTPAPLPPESELGIAEFVERLYSVALGRPSDPAGKADWINRVMTQGYTGADVAKGFLFSPEFLGMDMSNDQFVEVLYKTFFDRAGDPDGKADWLNRMANGWTKENVIMGFIDSTEWANLCMTYGIPSGGQGVPNIVVQPSEGVWAFCTRLYTTCLNRDYDPNGLADWADRLANMKVTGTSAAWGFFFSTEFEAQNVSDEVFVTRLYRTFMGREPDPAGQADWMSRLTAGASREDVFYGFANSPEFGQICMSYGILR